MDLDSCEITFKWENIGQLEMGIWHKFSHVYTKLKNLYQADLNEF
jgi:hypothetical protein